jgi:CubicO group peptidase (beta-lactamase class C family)
MTSSLDFTRRAVVSGAAGAGLLLGASPAFAFPAAEAYQNVTGAQHQANFDRLGKAGFAPISLGVYGAPSDPRYAAVWVAGGGGFAAVHGVNAAQYQTAFQTWSSKGFAPAVVSATGDAGNAVFAVVFRPAQGAWKARHGMTRAQFDVENDSARAAQLILTSVGCYGTPSDRRYIAVWRATPANVKWQVTATVSEAAYQQEFELWASVPQFRPVCTSVSSDGAITAVFTDEGIGPWVARHGMTGDQYQAAGRMPVMVQAGGGGGATRFAAIFATQAAPSARTWRFDGAAPPPRLASTETLLRNFMAKHGVRAAQLTVAKNGAVQFQRAYTWAEPDYRMTRLSDRFLLASTSKAFVAAAVQACYDAKLFDANTKPYAYLGLKKPRSATSDDITMAQILAHTAGYTYDPTYNMRTIANEIGLSGPCAKIDIVRYMYLDRGPDYTPGMAPSKDGYIYNNYGYLLASAVIEKATGRDYFSYLGSQILQPEGIADVAIYPTANAPRAATFAIAEDVNVGDSALAPKSARRVPCIFSGDGMVKETAVGSCGLAASANALAQLAHRHAAWGVGGRALGGRSGSTPGASSFMQSLDRDVDWALTMNTRNWLANSPDKMIDAFYKSLTDAINGAAL